ncbi:hypothetical protein QA644_14570 [Rhizobium sp. CC1099]|uniref:hypothetical protein n=1 Tax=Rhizobium sp. CC1099 TaxID=3039160 RepID=UPI0024B1C915|nr:hypothetical protein [Rhizobium sp. CC1099]WFU86350.1 hypothetical protein QA644_14570 [Rhizobium sp. CC1099]
MSRYTITVTKTASRHSDPDAVIGYDRPLQTFFLQAFPDLRAAALAKGYDFIPISSGTLRKLLDDYSREALRSVPDGIIQDLLSSRAPSD